MSKKQKQVVAAGLRSIFPSGKSIDSFERDNPGVLKRMLPSLAEKKIIANPSRESLEKLVLADRMAPDESEVNRETGFEEFLRNNIAFSLKELAAKLNTIARQLELQSLFNDKKIGTAMFSRLKTMPADTPIKRNYLRLLAFFLGTRQSDPASQYHYEALRSLCTFHPPKKDPHGIRVAFGINVIDLSAFKLLRNMLKTFMAQTDATKDLNIQSLSMESMFALYIDIPNRKHSDRISDTSPYQAGIRDAISLSHKLLIQWQLVPKSPIVRPNLLIGVMAGKFSEIGYMRQVLSLKNPTGYPQIRITEFTKKCLTENNVRATLTDKAEVIHFPNELPLYTWEVTGLWTWIYLDIVHEFIIKESNDSGERICLPNQYLPVRVNPAFKSAIQLFYKDTRNAVLGMEIAKTFYYRKKFLNALEVLEAILREDPGNLNALTLKMTILFNQAAAIDDPQKSEIQFLRAEDIADRIFHSDQCHDEDAFTEIGIGRLAKAVVHLRYFRKTSLRDDPNRTLRDEQRRIIISLIMAAEKAFIRGTNASNTGHRSMYYILITRTLLWIIRSRNCRFSDTGIDVAEPKFLRSIAHQLFADIGWIPNNPLHTNLVGLERPMTDAIQSFGESVLLQCYKANTFVVFALLVHDLDLTLFREEDNRKTIYSWLEEALAWARRNKQDGLYIYSDTRRGYGELLSYNDFAKHIDALKTIVSNTAEKSFILANIFDG